MLTSNLEALKELQDIYFFYKFLSPLGLKPGTSHKPFLSLYHLRQASRVKMCTYMFNRKRNVIHICAISILTKLMSHINMCSITWKCSCHIIWV